MVRRLQLAAAFAAATLPCNAAATPCDLSGEWRATINDRDTYKFVQTGTGTGLEPVTVTDQPAAALQQQRSGHWKKCWGTIDSSGLVALVTDTNHKLSCHVDANCSALAWDHGPAWCRVGSADCKTPPAPSPHAPPPTPPIDGSIKHVHVIAMNHLDIGFSCKGCGGSASDRAKLETMPAPYTWQLLNFYSAPTPRRDLVPAGS